MRLMTNLVTFRCPLCGDSYPVAQQKRLCFPESASLQEREAKVCVLCWGNLIIKIKRGIAHERESWGQEPTDEKGA